MLERVLLLLILSLLAAGFVQAWRWRLRRQLGRLRREPVSDLVRDLHLPDLPTILYFTTPSCSQCKFQQTPTLERLSRAWGGAVHVRRIDAFEHADLARHFGVMTAPTTVTLDAEHRLAAINHGLASADTLQAQIEPLLTKQDGPPGPRSLAPQHM